MSANGVTAIKGHANRKILGRLQEGKKNIINRLRAIRVMKCKDLENIYCNVLKEAAKQCARKRHSFVFTLQDPCENFLLGAQSNGKYLMFLSPTFATVGPEAGIFFVCDR